MPTSGNHLLIPRNLNGYVLAGAASLNWDDSTPLEYWEGMVLDGAPARVTGLNLPEKGLSARIPRPLSELDRLAVLRHHRNRLTGAIPSELEQLADLRELGRSPTS